MLVRLDEVGMAVSSQHALEVGASTVSKAQHKTGLSHAAIMGVIRLIGGGMIGVAVLVVVLNEVFSLEQIADTEGEFSSVTESLTGIGGAALGLLVIGFLVIAANQVMGFFGSGGF